MRYSNSETTKPYPLGSGRIATTSGGLGIDEENRDALSLFVIERARLPAPEQSFAFAELTVASSELEF
ncbi:hypothetical protein FXE18_02110 [Vibrio cholerae]|nr:hypothetical protein [Vibrio cholerae]TXX76864.1 hypothetical protein FXE96_06770 [Vibrio cholerae]TYA68626.1 hypothetical protein FXE18_02110 [Vibrio cholerae]